MNSIKTLVAIVVVFGMSINSFADIFATIKTDWKNTITLAEQGNADAQLKLGFMHTYGDGVLKDDKQAIKWFRKAAEQGHAGAQNNLGAMYDDGKGVLKDDKEAVKWFLKAAEQGLASAQYNLGKMHANGEGVLKDLSKAKYWIKKAYENPDVSASTREFAEKLWNVIELWKY